MKLVAISIAVCAVFSMSGVMPAGAQVNYPAKPIKFVVPYSAGGSPDMFARTLSKSLAPSLGQPVVVENRPGGNSTIGVNYLAKSAPDGYSIMISASGPLSSARALFKSLP